MSARSINTRNKHHLHRPDDEPPSFQKSTPYAGIKILNSLLCKLTSLRIERAQFKVASTKPFEYTFLFD